MEKEQLLRKLISLNVHPKHYSLVGEIKDNAYNIERLYNGKYAFYHLERGEKDRVKTFDTEEEALSALINALEMNINYGLDMSK